MPFSPAVCSLIFKQAWSFLFARHAKSLQRWGIPNILLNYTYNFIEGQRCCRQAVQITCHRPATGRDRQGRALYSFSPVRWLQRRDKAVDYSPDLPFLTPQCYLLFKMVIPAVWLELLHRSTVWSCQYGKGRHAVRTE